MLRHEAALASGQLTRGSPGGQPTYRKSLCLGHPRDPSVRLPTMTRRRNDRVARLIRDLAEIGEGHGRRHSREVKGKITIRSAGGRIPEPRIIRTRQTESGGM